MSFLIIAFKAGKLHIGGMDALGTQFRIGNPAALPPMMFALLVYFLWRYCGGFGDTLAWQLLFNQGSDYLADKINDFAFQKAKEKISAEKEATNDPLQLNLIDKKLEALVQNNPCDRKWLSWTYKFPLNLDTAGKLYATSKNEVEAVLNGWELLKKRIACGYYLLIRRSAFSEYLFPFLLAFIAILELSGVKFVEHIFVHLENYLPLNDYSHSRHPPLHGLLRQFDF
ncbi:MAG: hypothetical protein KGL10_00855 [Alphaproteobacteria bacterium]|nr:hypothetical protein [Alphaproteobacteria bacterium]MDE2335841.1 hypothetical protein [Alphaproteobacteria bacterium]